MVRTSASDDRARIIELIQWVTATRGPVPPSDLDLLRRYFAGQVLPARPTTRVREKHAKQVEDDLQWPEDTSPDEYLESLREAILNPRTGMYLVEADIEGTWTLYFVGPVPYRSRGRYAGDRIVVLFNAEHHFWITGFQAEAGDAYVNRRPGFWIQTPH